MAETIKLECPTCGEQDHLHIPEYDDLAIGHCNVTCLKCSQARQHTFVKPTKKAAKKAE